MNLLGQDELIERMFVPLFSFSELLIDLVQQKDQPEYRLRLSLVSANKVQSSAYLEIIPVCGFSATVDADFAYIIGGTD